jgi:hypothetical protein
MHELFYRLMALNPRGLQLALLQTLIFQTEELEHRFNTIFSTSKNQN